MDGVRMRLLAMTDQDASDFANMSERGLELGYADLQALNIMQLSWPCSWRARLGRSLPGAGQVFRASP